MAATLQTENEPESVNHLGIHQLAYTALDDPHSDDEADYENFANFEFGNHASTSYRGPCDIKDTTAFVGTGTSYTHNSAVRRQEKAELCSIMEAMRMQEPL